MIQTHHLTRNFKKVRAVDGLTFAIQTGELFGLVGPDGAGKTTTLRLLAGLLDVSEGNADMLGFDLKEKSESIKPHVGYMAQQFSLYSELSVMENLQFFSELFDVKAQELAERAERLLNFAGLIEFTNRRAGNLSGGMQKKLALACTLIHEPEILLLDEPTTGVDPISRREFWNILTDLHLQGTTILVSTPYMECDSPKAIRDKLEGEIIEIRPQRPEDWQKILSVVTSLNGVSEAQTYGESVHLLVDSGERRMTQVRHALEAENIPYRSIRIAPARMEEAFISLMRKMEA